MRKSIMWLEKSGWLVGQIFLCDVYKHCLVLQESGACFVGRFFGFFVSRKTTYHSKSLPKVLSYQLSTLILQKSCFFLKKNVEIHGLMVINTRGRFFIFIFMFTPKSCGRWTPFDEHIFQMGWLKPPTRTVSQTASPWLRSTISSYDPGDLATQQ